MSFMLESGLSIHRLLSVCIRKRKVQGRYRTGTDAYSAVSPYNPDRLFLITTPFLFLDCSPCIYLQGDVESAQHLTIVPC
jgi:hypothetical protein